MKRKSINCKVKKLLDAFFDPWQLQGHKGTISEIINAIQLYATDNLDLTECEFNKAFNSKAGKAKWPICTISIQVRLSQRRQKGRSVVHLILLSQNDHFIMTLFMYSRYIHLNAFKEKVYILISALT